MRISEQKLNPSLKKQINITLSQTICDLNSTQEASEFLSDFFTPSELETFAKRLAIGYWLQKGRSYSNIKDNLKVSSATIATVQNMLNLKGFQLALKKANADEWAQKWSEKIKKYLH
ncbi:hypothetical protein A2382_04810 [Candidatus Woesebacteria bacterium RIFOXYB1_FULL_38_16]|uniref:TrpR like protein, YerC/YecD n=1 Tax=Candidatus Woesebacteria bacterium RIFOXYB1_FULL_38_16 TaxID=1802538 RepID=A0A1F8CVY5_9BACT|nr:MAG: hypothetical protein A2191_00355 [Candidatus Woesebacteria bacterium RIFOXYA1_FULL_38_9]OGM79979.1 MAG: hypothetical protein A2382_04810 [Candidatus Woesebacteria bacterium RIFOXYB1_FULL_38_16]